MVVLTNIALEHTEVLGDTRELIFAEKAAVIKGGDAVFGPLDGLGGGGAPGLRRRRRAAALPARVRPDRATSRSRALRTGSP